MHKLFQDHGAQGAVFHYDSEYAQHGKFLVILNEKWPPADEIIIYAYTTSQTHRFDDGKVPESTIVRLEPGDYSFCKVPTVIDLTAIKTKKASEISESGMFKFVCQLDGEDLERVLDAVQASIVIARKHKKAILGNRYG